MHTKAIMQKSLLRLYNFFIFAPQGYLAKKLFSLRWRRLLFLFIICWIGIAVVFAWIYSENGNIKPSSQTDVTFIDLIYFSFITQATVGYGDFTPQTAGAKIIVICQTCIGSIISTLGFAIIVSKLLSSTHNILFPKKICYDNENHMLLIWCLNNDANGLHSFSNSVGVEAVSPSHDRDTRDIRFKLRVAKQQTHVDGMGGFVIKTLPPPPGTLLPTATYDNEFNFVTVCSVDQYENPLFGLLNNGWSPTVAVEVRAVSCCTGDPVYFRKVYELCDIVCGKTLDLWPKGTAKPKSWLDRVMKNYGGIDPITATECYNCSAHQNCRLPTKQIAPAR